VIKSFEGLKNLQIRLIVESTIMSTMEVMPAEGDANGGALPPAAAKPRVERGEVLPEADVFSASEIGQVLRYLYRSDRVGECVGCDLATVAYFGRDSDVGPLALLPIDSQFESAMMLARRWARSRSSKSLSNFVAALPRDVSKPFCIESRFADVATEMLTLSIEAKSRIDAKMARANELALSLICMKLKKERGGSSRSSSQPPCSVSPSPSLPSIFQQVDINDESKPIDC
jgi:hypothetical protein